MGSIEAALAAIDSLEPGKLITYTEIAKQFGVDRSTLSRHHRGVQRSKEDQYESQRVLNNQQAKELINYINKLTDRGLYPTHEMLRNFAKEITGIKPGKHWPGRFLKKHNKDLISRYTTGIDAARKRADSAFKYALYFEFMGRKIKEYDVQPENMYNMDEKGFLIGILPKGKRIFSRRRYEKALSNTYRMVIGSGLLRLLVSVQI
jgi:alkylated DNA nucleotide flippase Atl1